MSFKKFISQGSGNLNLNSKLNDINLKLSRVSFIGGWSPCNQDIKLFNKFNSLFTNNNNTDCWLHIKRWLVNIKSYSAAECSKFPIVNDTNDSLIELAISICSDVITSDGHLDQKVRQ